MSLVGVTILGNTFVQDPNPNWIKINNVAIGESKNYGYSTANSVKGDIGGLLSNLSQDPNVVVVIYNWNTGIAYTKTGFNLSVSSDYQQANGYTTFVLQSKVSQFYQGPIGPPIGPPIVNSSYVKYQNGMFVLNGNKFVPVGFNAYWLSYTENYDYPPTYQVDEMFNAALKLKATVIRSHTLGSSTGSSNSLRPNSNQLNNNAWTAIDYAFYKAQQTGVKLICPLTDSYNYFNGNYGDYCNTRGIDKTQFWTDSNVRNDFKNFIYNWLNHVNSYTKVAIKNSHELFAIELGNELGNIRPDSGSTTIPTQEWISDISSYIKSIDNCHLVLNGSDECLGSSTSNDFQVNTVDIHSAHFYGEDYNRINYGANNAKNVGKGYIIGEYSSQFGQDWFNIIEKIPNVLGTMVWSFYPHDNGQATGNRVIHNDNFTLYPDNQDSQNTQQLLLLTNHMRRMQGLPEVNQLNW